MNWVRDLGGCRGWAIAATVAQVQEELVRLAPEAVVVTPLGGSPVACEDLRARGWEARAAGQALVVDDSLPGPTGCAAVRLGAHVALVGLSTCCLAAVSADAEQAVPSVTARLEKLPPADRIALEQVDDAIGEQGRRWHASSDAAQVVASYLRCHPRVAELRYPGLKGDPSFEVAARTLSHGFGPLIDYRLTCESAWRRLRCDERDARAQVMSLERALTTK